MNEKPHTHPIRVFNHSIRYGDTEVAIVHWFFKWPSKKRFNRLVRRAIRKHDRGTLRAAKRVRRQLEVENVYNEKLTLPPKLSKGPGFYDPFHKERQVMDKWGTDILDEKV